MTARGGLRVLLVSMPWHALDRPSLGLSLLRGALERDGTACEVRYLGFSLADAIGVDDYLWVQSELPYTASAGDWLFTAALYGAQPAQDAAYVDTVLRGEWRLDDASVARLLRVRARLEPWLEHCVDAVPWRDHDVVGLTSTFEQNIASLALARRVREVHPSALLAFGGANWEAGMGEALHRAFPFVDVVADGEADTSFPALVRALSAGLDARTVPGLVVRGPDGSTVRTGDGEPVKDLDDLPVPCYDDFLEQQQASTAASGLVPTLLLETSRGCWWGAKHHCTFCGLNGGAMAFRSKSAPRVLAEVDGLLETGARSVAVVDNILDMQYFRTVLPVLAERGAPLQLFYEVKANLTRAQVRTLARAGVRRVQPGIESLDDGVLRLMRKGTTALQNVQLLKWCREYGVTPEWNVLYGFPREDREAYPAMLPLLRAIAHLEPPSGYGSVRLDRFSPYHQDPAGLGVDEVRPALPYRFLYPQLGHEQLMQVAYSFDFTHADRRSLDYTEPVVAAVRAWSAAGPQGALTVTARADGSALVLDSRDGSPSGFALEPWQARVYATIDSVTSTAAVLRAVGDLPADDVLGFLGACEERALAARTGDRWLGLAVTDPPRWDDAVPDQGSRVPLDLLPSRP